MVHLFPKMFIYLLSIDYVKWSKYNKSLVGPGEIWLGFDVEDNLDIELAYVSRGKIGETTISIPSMIHLL
ncbi:MAG: hypothetical protein R2685_15605 [Candidatus Nitrosocosmicus sp.]|nr:hypothetical protein [Candidatus Nitrosocosmicus sp.]